ncbi:MAG: NADH-quinone oxidoreductase subunit H, partial [Desulfuromonadales bacterium]|nr:NADH-quinone oxidoreductase subunit H [Desulfuromonadales bacterium]
SLQAIVNDQAIWHGYGWYIIRTPFMPIVAVIFFICSIAEINRTPFDFPEAESELVSGFITEYSSMKYAMFFMGEYANMVTVCAVVTTLFLGGWLGPLPSVINFIIKLYFLMFVCIWIRATYPRYRYDQLMRLGWKVFLPLTLVLIVLNALWVMFVVH